MTELVSQTLTDKQQALVDFLPECRTLKQAALKAGYSEQTAGNIKSKIRLSPKWAVAVKQAYLNNNITQLHTIMNIEEDILQLCANNVEEVPKFKDTIKQIKQQAGVLQADADYNKPSLTHITVNAQTFMAQINQAGPNGTNNMPNPAIEGEIIDE